MDRAVMNCNLWGLNLVWNLKKKKEKELLRRITIYENIMESTFAFNMLS
jgi:hypothetical protein